MTELNGGTLPAAVAGLFATHGFNLSGLPVETVNPGHQWKITDTTNENVQYFIELTNGQLVLRGEDQTFDLAPTTFAISLAGELEFQQPANSGNVWFRMDGGFYAQIDVHGLTMFARSHLIIGTDDPSILDFNAMGLLIINEAGIAAQMSVGLEAGDRQQLGFELSGQFDVAMNTSSANQSFLVPQLIYDAMSDADRLALGLTGTHRTLTVNAGPPRSDGSFGTPAPYLVIDGDGNLNLKDEVELTGHFRLEVTPQSIELTAAISTEISILGTMTGTAAFRIDSDGLVGVAQVALGSSPSITGVDLELQFYISVNTTGSARQIETYTVSTADNTFGQLSSDTSLQTVPDGVYLKAGGSLELGPDNSKITLEGQFSFGLSSTSLEITAQGRVDMGVLGHLDVSGSFHATSAGIVTTLNVSANANLGDIGLRFSGNFMLVTIGGVTLTIAGVEQIDLNLIGGGATLVVDSLSNTNLTRLNLELGVHSVAANLVMQGGATADTYTLTTEDGGLRVAKTNGPSVFVRGASSTAGDSLTIRGNGGNDTIDAGAVTTWPIVLVFYGDAGDDTIIGGFGTAVVDGGADISSFTFDDSAAGNLAAPLNAANISTTRGGTTAVTPFANVQTRTVKLNGGFTGATTIRAGNANGTSSIYLRASSGATTVSTAHDGFTVYLGSADNRLDTMAGAIDIIGTGATGATRLVVNGSGVTAGSVAVHDGDVSGLGLVGALTYAGLTQLEVKLGIGNDFATIDLIQPKASSYLIQGSTGDDIFAITADTGIASVTVTGEAGSDTFNVNANHAARLSLTANGDGDADTFNVTTANGASVSGGLGGGDGSDIATISLGSASSNSLIANVERVVFAAVSAAGTTWTLDNDTLKAGTQTVLSTTNTTSSDLTMTGSAGAVKVLQVNQPTVLDARGTGAAITVGGTRSAPFANIDLGGILKTTLIKGDGTLTLDDTRHIQGGRNVLMSAGAVSGFVANAQIQYERFSRLELSLGSVVDTVTLSGTSVQTTLKTGNCADVVSVTGLSHIATIELGGDADSIAISSASGELTIDGGNQGAAVSINRASATSALVGSIGNTGATPNLLLIGLGLGNITIKSASQLDIALGSGNDDFTFDSTVALTNGVNIDSGAGADVVAVKRLGAVTTIDAGIDADTVKVVMAGAPAPFTNLQLNDGIEALVVDNTGNTAGVNWTVKGGKVLVGSTQILDVSGAGATRILGGSGTNSLTVQTDNVAGVSGTVDGDRVELIDGQEVLDYLGMQTGLSEPVDGPAGLRGATDLAVTTDGQFIYVAGRLGDAITVFRRGAAGAQLQYIETIQRSPETSANHSSNVAAAWNAAIAASNPTNWYRFDEIQTLDVGVQTLNVGNYLYVLSSSADTLRVLGKDSSGDFNVLVQTYATPDNPVVFAARPDGQRIYMVSQPASGPVVVTSLFCNTTTGLLETDLSGTLPETFTNPTDLRVDANGKGWVTGSGGQVHQLFRYFTNIGYSPYNLVGAGSSTVTSSVAVELGTARVDLGNVYIGTNVGLQVVEAGNIVYTAARAGIRDVAVATIHDQDIVFVSSPGLLEMHGLGDDTERSILRETSVFDPVSLAVTRRRDNPDQYTLVYATTASGDIVTYFTEWYADVPTSAGFLLTAFNHATYRIDPTLFQYGLPTSLSVSADGTELYATTNDSVIYVIAGDGSLSFDRTIQNIAVDYGSAHPNGIYHGGVTFGETDANVVRIFRREANGSLTALPNIVTSRPNTLAFAPDGRYLFVASADISGIGGITAVPFDNNGPTTAAPTFYYLAATDVAPNLSVSAGSNYLYATSKNSNRTYAFQITTSAGNPLVALGAQDGLTNANAVAVSPDGRSLYEVGSPNDSLVAYNVATNGTLSQPQTIVRAQSYPIDLTSLTSLTSAPNGKLYALAPDQNAIVALNADMTMSRILIHGYDGDIGLQGATSLVVSPDGNFVYVVSPVLNTVATFLTAGGTLACVRTFSLRTDVTAARTLTFGSAGTRLFVAGTDRLIALAVAADGVLTTAGSLGVTGINSLASMPRLFGTIQTGDYVFATDGTGNRLMLISFDRVSGQFDVSRTLTDGVSGIDGLAGASSVAISADGSFIYVTAATDSSVSVFSRNVTFLTQVGVYKEGNGGANGMAGARAVALLDTAFGSFAVVAGSSSNSLAVFFRNADGTMQFAQSLSDIIAGNAGLVQPNSLAVAPGNASIYVATSAGAGANRGGVARFQNLAASSQLPQPTSRVTTFSGMTTLTITTNAGNDSIAVRSPPQFTLPTEFAISEGGTLNLQATLLAGGPTTFVWDLNGDGIFTDASGAAVSLSWSQLVALGLRDDNNGQAYRIVARATNSQGSRDAASLVTIANTSPSITIVGDASVGTGVAYTIQFSATQYTNEAILGWTVNWGDGAPSETFGSGATTATHIFSTAAIRTITVSVDNGDVGNTPQTASVTVVNLAPTIGTFTVPSTGSQGTAFAVSASASDSNPLDVLTYSWTVTRNNRILVTTQEPSFSYTPLVPGTFVVSLTVRDSSNLASATTIGQVIVANAPPTIQLVQVGTFMEGQVGTISVAAADPGVGGDPLSYQYDFDNTGVFTVPVFTPSVSHTFTSDGPKTVNIRVLDRNGGIANATISIDVAAVAAVAHISGSPVGTEGQDYTLTLGPVGPAEADAITGWSINWGDGTIDAVAGNVASAAHRYRHDGNYVIQATVTNDDGTYDAQATVVVAVAAVPPLVSISGPALVGEGDYSLALEFSKYDNDPADGWIINWGDGSAPQTVFGSPSVVTHRFNGPSQHTISATALNGDASYVTNSIAVQIENVAPIIESVTLVEPLARERTAIALHASATDAGEDTLIYSFDFDNDGVYDASNLSGVAQYAFPDGGAYPVRVLVTDSEGGDAVTTFTVEVCDIAPGLNLSSTPSSGLVYVGQTAQLNLTFRGEDAGDILTYRVNWGDGAIGDYTVALHGLQPTHVYSTPGELTVTVYDVSDSRNNFGVMGSQTLTGRDVPPTIALSGADDIRFGQPYALTLGALVAAATTPVTAYVVQWGDGESMTVSAAPIAGTTLAHTYAFEDAGAQTISVTLYDANGSHVGGQKSIEVISDTPPVVSDIAKQGSEDMTLTFSATDFVAGYHDLSGDPLALVIVRSLPANGTLRLNGIAVTVNQEIAAAQLGGLTFTPDANWNGQTSFRWKGHDGTSAAADEANVNLTILSVNDAPIAVSDTFTTLRSATLTGNVSSNDSDAHNGAPGESNTPLTVAIVQRPAHAAAFSLSSNGEFTYTPAVGFVGSDRFTYRTIDSLGTVSAPVAVDIAVHPLTLPTGVHTIGDVLYVIGGNGNDYVSVAPLGTSNTGSTGVRVQATLHNVWFDRTFTQSFRLIHIETKDGGDSVEMTASLVVPTFVDAGSGSNYVQTGCGASTIVAGDGNDTVFTGAGNDVIDVGGGNNYVSAGDGDNTIVAANGNLGVLAGIGFDIASRLVVTSESARDVLFGNGGLDWFWFDSRQIATDMLPIERRN